MDREAVEVGACKRVTSSTTVSLDSTYDRDRDHVDDLPAFDGWSWAPFVVLLGLFLMAVVLMVFILDRGDNKYQQQANEVEVVGASEPSFVLALDDKNLTAPQKKLVGWLKQMRNASELYVEADNSGMSLTGVLFPRNNSDESIPFDSLLAINSDTITANQQIVAIAGGRGYEWSVVLSDVGDTILASGCLMAQNNQSFPTLASVISTSRWRSKDPHHRGVQVVVANTTYTMTMEQGGDETNSKDNDSSRCWLVESNDIGVYICIPEMDDQLSKSDFKELFQATDGCPNLVPNSTHSVSHAKRVLVPLPLRKWYASYKPQVN